MLKVLLRSSKLLLLLCLAGMPGSVAIGQETPLQRQLQRIDFAISGVGMFTKNVSGPVLPVATNTGVTLSQSASNTLGALATIRYTKSPWVGGEFNYSYARYTENYSSAIIGGAQTNASEYTLGYVAHGPSFLGLQTFGAVGAGSIAFRPTPFGGQGLRTQARMAYYYAAGVEAPVLSEHFGVRAQVRQVFFLAPDFGQNYLTIKQHTNTFEPGFGFYLRF